MEYYISNYENRCKHKIIIQKCWWKRQKQDAHFGQLIWYFSDSCLFSSFINCIDWMFLFALSSGHFETFNIWNLKSHNFTIRKYKWSRSQICLMKSIARIGWHNPHKQSTHLNTRNWSHSSTCPTARLINKIPNATTSPPTSSSRSRTSPASTSSHSQPRSTAP